MKPATRLAVLAALNSPSGRRVIITVLVALLGVAGVKLEPQAAEAVTGLALPVIQALAQ